MLVLSRKNHESVVVGGSNPLEQLLKVTVLEVRRGKVILGIEGDRDVPVYRSEIWDRMCAAERIYGAPTYRFRSLLAGLTNSIEASLVPPCNVPLTRLSSFDGLPGHRDDGRAWTKNAEAQQ
jgi:carbon storage regulator CsrA